MYLICVATCMGVCVANSSHTLLVHPYQKIGPNWKRKKKMDLHYKQEE